MYEPRINALFITPIGGTAQGPLDVRDKVVAFANPQSLVAMYGQQWLLQQKLEAGKDYQVKAARTDMGVGRMLLTGEVAGAVMSNGEFRALPQDESGRLRTVEAFARIPNFIVVAHPRLGAARINRLKTQFKSFIADKDEGAAFSKATGITGMVDADDAVLRELDPYVAPTRRAMGISN
jgi:ABC-type phosphate/phosphonate transport system substrate-binding protein